MSCDPATPQCDGYHGLSLVHRSGSACVFQAIQSSTGQSVAIKAFDPEFELDPSEQRRLEEGLALEADVCASVQHPNIARLLDTGWCEDTGRRFIVHEWISGATLAEILGKETLAPRESLRMMGQVLDALGGAHQSGVVHRDLKPSNIAVSDQGARRNALVLDFGIAAIVGRPSPAGIGTPSYAAPEQLRGQEPEAASDLYSWALVLLECLTGACATRAMNLQPTVSERLSSRPPMPRWLRLHPLGRILQNATAPVPADRPELPELLSQLERVDPETLAVPDRGLDRARPVARAERATLPTSRTAAPQPALGTDPLSRAWSRALHGEPGSAWVRADARRAFRAISEVRRAAGPSWLEVHCAMGWPGIVSALEAAVGDDAQKSPAGRASSGLTTPEDLADCVRAFARNCPLLLALKDVQRADAETRAFASHLATEIRSAAIFGQESERLLLVATAPKHFRPMWSLSDTTWIDLSQERAVIGTRALPELESATRA